MATEWQGASLFTWLGIVIVILIVFIGIYDRRSQKKKVVKEETKPVFTSKDRQMLTLLKLIHEVHKAR